MKRFLFIFSIITVVVLASCKKEDMLSLDDDEFIFEYTAETETTTVISNVRWTAVATVDWITLNPTGAKITAPLRVSVTENTGDSERYGEIIVTQIGGEQLSDTLKVIQKKAP